MLQLVSRQCFTEPLRRVKGTGELTIGNYLGGRVAGLYESIELWQLFGIVAGPTIGGAIVLAALIIPLKKLMGGVR